MLQILAFTTALLAEGASLPTAEQVTSWVGMGSSLAFSIWYARHCTVVTIPELNKNHATTIEKINTNHATTIERINTDNNALILRMAEGFSRDLKVERDAYAAAIQGQREDCRQEVQTLLSVAHLRANTPSGGTST